MVLAGGREYPLVRPLPALSCNHMMSTSLSPSPSPCQAVKPESGNLGGVWLLVRPILEICRARCSNSVRFEQTMSAHFSSNRPHSHAPILTCSCFPTCLLSGLPSRLSRLHLVVFLFIIPRLITLAYSTMTVGSTDSSFTLSICMYASDHLTMAPTVSVYANGKAR